MTGARVMPLPRGQLLTGRTPPLFNTPTWYIINCPTSGTGIRGFSALSPRGGTLRMPDYLKSDFVPPTGLVRPSGGAVVFALTFAKGVTGYDGKDDLAAK